MRYPSAFLLALFTAVLHANAQLASDDGFISIDCGLPSGSRYVDEKTSITYVSDDGYIDTGENHNISSEYQEAEQFKSGLNLRSFPGGGRNCYTLSSVTKGQKYLIRGTFMYGNYDDKRSNLISSPLVFDIYIGLDFWSRVIITSTTMSMTYAPEVIVVAALDFLSVCLIDIGKGIPFISSLEMRPMKSSLYPAAMTNQSIALQERQSMGANDLCRYPDDPYDRLWWPSSGITGWLNLSTTGTIKLYATDSFEVPARVLRTAVTSRATSIPLNFSWSVPTGWPIRPIMEVAYYYYLNLYFTDFQQKQLREFQIYYHDFPWGPKKLPISPPYLTAYWLRAINPYNNEYNFYNVSLVATNNSELPPILNAFEIYYRVSHDGVTTISEDVDSMMTIKIDYQVKKNWMGDPCLPKSYTWSGLKCTSDGSVPRVISLDLSHSGLQGAISEQFSLLKSLQYLNLSYNDLKGSVPDSLANLPSLLVLDLSGNHLDGTIPEGLCTKHLLSLRYDTANGDPCNGKSPEHKNTVVLRIAIVIPVVIVVLLVSTFLVYYLYRKKDHRSQEGCRSYIHTPDSREFTYEELVKITNNFSVCIGEGGFGPVFHGQLEDGNQVAVKMHSPTSAIGKGMTEFLAEVGSLTTVHHRYIVLLVGYCSKEEHLALVYEYMPNGSLHDHLRGQNAIVQALSWRDRVRIALEAAQGLDYLHTGCVLPIIHRDVKLHNILLGHNMVAKISDFGLSKSYMDVAQSHISVTATAGTPGYIDPQYYVSGRLTISSDVFSFGVVLLEIVTGEAPITQTTDQHIVQRVRGKVQMGNIVTIVDPLLHGEYDFSSVWKVVDIALLCTKEASRERPTMSTVVAQLKEASALEEAHASDRISNHSKGGANTELSINSMPTPR